MAHADRVCPQLLNALGDEVVRRFSLQVTLG
jgi:hypothetical protein